jgi:hypothetical protein
MFTRGGNFAILVFVFEKPVPPPHLFLPLVRLECEDLVDRLVILDDYGRTVDRLHPEMRAVSHEGNYVRVARTKLLYCC